MCQAEDPPALRSLLIALHETGDGSCKVILSRYHEELQTPGRSSSGAPDIQPAHQSASAIWKCIPGGAKNRNAGSSHTEGQLSGHVREGLKAIVDPDSTSMERETFPEGDSDGHHGNGRPVRNPSHTVMVNSDRIVTQGLGKRPRKGGDDFNQLRKTKRLQVKSAEIIDDLDETPTAGPSHLHVQAMSSHHNDVQQHSAFSSDSEATVGIPLQHTTGVPIVPTFNPHDPFSMMDDAPIPNRDMSFPLLDPSLFQGPEFEALVAQYQSRYEVDRFY
ncbi:hypothetical protein BS47DRAFT_1369571 [Hydnum rufescens UP504]|uniref:Uncharacterized protein n=1 Tax=Hydnum rufescens UP504 TaxID=1448309 RepID=A0A9P6ACW4_9AGAM|nr:hypothetical protein BS47DRAFT_1369571 [Hydnum rufescens UP504]